MALEIKEYIGSCFSITESNTKSGLGGSLNIKEGYNDLDPIASDSLMQDIEGIHVGPTRNFTWYTEQALESSIPSWTKPYQRPLIMHHNEKDGKIIGRVVNVVKETKNTRSGTPALIFTCNVPDKEGKEQILDGRLKTVSIGVIAHDVRCSICGEQISLDHNGEPECGHMRGAMYEDKICYWMIYKMEAKELSYVIVPSDIYAHNIRTYKPTNKDLGLKESLDLNEGKVKDMAIDKTNIDLGEGQVIDEEVKDAAKTGEVVDTKETEKEVESKEEDKKDETKTTEKAEEAKKEDESKKEEEPKKDEKDTKIEELEKKLEKLETEKAELAAKIEGISTELASANTKLEKVSKDLTDEIALKESAENQLIEIKTELREATEENLIALRTVLNKPVIVKESLTSRSLESIKDSISDLKEEMAGLSAVKNIAEAVDPTINKEKNKEITKPTVKESKNNSNIDLEEGLKDLMSSFLM